VGINLPRDLLFLEEEERLGEEECEMIGEGGDWK